MQKVAGWPPVVWEPSGVGCKGSWPQTIYFLRAEAAHLEWTPPITGEGWSDD